MSLEFGKVFGSSTSATGLPNLTGFIPVRVTEVNITPNKEDSSLFKVQSEYWGVGSIRFESLNEAQNLRGNVRNNIALPLNINVRTLPIVNEIVFVILGPSKESMQSGDPTAQTYYYTNSLPTWNNTNANIFPSQLGEGNTSTDTNDTSTIEDGIPNNPDNEKTGPKTGVVYEEEGEIKNLYPQEGDIIFEGRFGNSLRFSSTGKYEENFDEFNVSPQNPWSRDGKKGSPITILRNGQEKGVAFDAWEPIFEDINNDGSSVYLTSNQNIPIELAYPFLASYGVDITLPEDTTTEFEKISEPEGNEFISNSEADSLDKAQDSINVEPLFDTDSLIIDGQLPDIPDVGVGNLNEQPQDTTLGGSNINDDGRPLSAAQRKRNRQQNRSEGNNLPQTAAQRKRKLRGQDNNSNNGRESAAQRKRNRQRGG